MANHATPEPSLTPSPAETLRRAAELMRERANAVDALSQLTETITEATCDEFADFIASWDPAVARAVADLLDEAAEEADNVESIYAKHFDRARPEWAKETRALAVARAYLGEDE